MNTDTGVLAGLEFWRLTMIGQTPVSMHSKNMVDIAPRRLVKILTILLSASLFVGSLALPAFHSGGDGVPTATTTGLTALCMGWFPALFGLIGLPRGNVEYLGMLAWFANPLLLVSCICVGIGWRLGGVMFAGLAVPTALIFLSCRTIPIPNNQTLTHIVPGTGYSLWIASMVVALVGAMVMTLVESKRDQL